VTDGAGTDAGLPDGVCVGLVGWLGVGVRGTVVVGSALGPPTGVTVGLAVGTAAVVGLAGAVGCGAVGCGAVGCGGAVVPVGEVAGAGAAPLSTVSTAATIGTVVASPRA